MEWLQVVVILVSFFGLFLWNRSESRNDWRQTDNDIKSLDSKLENKIESSHRRMDQLYGVIIEMLKK